jgi:hypothetical protein
VATSSTPAGPGTISGTIYGDLNKNFVQDSGETGLSGITVWLHKAATTTAPWWRQLLKLGTSSDPIIATATTDAGGTYSFGNLTPGIYYVEVGTTDGWRQNTGDTKVALTADKPSADVDFSFVKNGATGGKGHGDSDGDNDDNASSTGHGNNGNHFGWFQIRGSFASWLHFGKNK